MPTVTDPTAPFRTKDFLTLIDGMILTARAHTERVTDYNVGSVARTLLEAPGLELDALYQAMTLNLLDAIPVAIYQGFSFTALPAMAAAGFVTFTLGEPLVGNPLRPAANRRPVAGGRSRLHPRHSGQRHPNSWPARPGPGRPAADRSY